MSSKFLQALAGKRVYPITDQHLSGLSHPEQIKILSDSGAHLVQLREKIDSPAKFYNEAEAALHVARERGVALIINDRVDIAMALQVDGVHLGQEDLPPGVVRRMLGPRAIIGFSTHNLQQAQLAARMPIDYLAIGPIFTTATKISSNPAVGLKNLMLVRQALGALPLVAIGGITAENMGAVLNAGADAVALISDLWTATKQPNQKIQQLLQSFIARPR
jgi:thiamine-phosphate pyrophosphorylase